MSSRRFRVAAALAAPALLFLALHLRALDYGFVWTDHPEIEGGSILRPPGRWLEAFGQPLHQVGDFRVRQLPQPYYRPFQVVTVSWLDRRFGREPRSFRGASLMLGAAASTLAAGVVLLLSGSGGAALVAGCVFAAHPVGLATWVWISGLSAALAMTFSLASLLMALAALRARLGAARLALAAASTASLALALLSKEAAAVTPALLAAGAAGLRLEASRRDATRPDSPRAFARWAAGIVAVQGALVLLLLAVVRPRVLGAVLSALPPLRGSLTTQVATALGHWPEALAGLLLPLRPNTSDAVRLVTSVFDPAALLGAGLLVGTAVAVWLLARRGLGLTAAALAWIWIGFLPTSGLVPLLHLGAERNLFFALPGTALLWASTGPLLRRIGLPRAGVAALAALLVLGLAGRTWTRMPDWRSTRALFERDVAADPRHREARLHLAFLDLQEGRGVRAKAHADTLVAQRSQAGQWSSFLMGWSDLEIHCAASENQERDADVLALWDAGVAGRRLRAQRAPGYHECVARALERSGREEEALAIWQQILELAPAPERAPFVLAMARCNARLGRTRAARAWLARVPRDGTLGPEIAKVARLIRQQQAPGR